MSAPTDSHLEIARVLFIDIIAYSKLLINQQTELVKELNKRGAQHEEFRAADAAGKLPRQRGRRSALKRATIFGNTKSRHR